MRKRAARKKLRAGKKHQKRRLAESRATNDKKRKQQKAERLTSRKEDVRIPSGIRNFDKIIEHGFEKNSVNLVVGGSGSGKTIFAVQFLVEGINRGENVLYITFEENKKEFYSNMKRFGWDLGRDEKEGKFFFLEYSPEKVMTMLEEGGGAIEAIVIKNNIQRIVIDSITSFALLFNEELAKREAALVLFDMIRKWNCTSLLTLQEEPSNRSEGYSVSLEFEADSIILLYFTKIRGERKRFIEVLKMRGTKHSTKTYPLAITEQGVVIGTTMLKKADIQL
jgi:circadian clock protein KaiC